MVIYDISTTKKLKKYLDANPNLHPKNKKINWLEKAQPKRKR
jgi:hypothetical protein